MKGKDLIKWIQDNNAEELTIFKEFGNNKRDLCDGYEIRFTDFTNSGLAWTRLDDGSIKTVHDNEIDTSLDLEEDEDHSKMVIL